VAITPEGAHLTIFTDPISPNGETVAAFGPDERVRLYPLNGGTPAIVPGLSTGEAPLLWSRDGTALFTVERLGATRWRVHRVDLRTQRKTLVRDIAPPAAGLMSILHVHAAADAHAHLFVLAAPDGSVCRGGYPVSSLDARGAMRRQQARRERDRFMNERSTPRGPAAPRGVCALSAPGRSCID
jgi:hypothetical protein